VPQQRERARFTSKALELVRLDGRELLDRDVTLENLVEGQPDGRARARAELALEPVATAE
jgi:hypothetical protein